MSDEDDTGTLVRGPWSGGATYVPPPIPDYGDTVSSSEGSPSAAPELPEETTMELPPIPAAPNPSAALRSEGIAAPETGEDDGEYEEYEYEQPRSLADRLGDWLEFRLERARANHESEAPFREAEIARKVALMEGRTAQDVAMMEQNGKLHAAMMKARSDKAAARGKADADRARFSGMGTDKTRSKSAGGPSHGGGGTRSSRNNSSPGPNRSGASHGSHSGRNGSSKNDGSGRAQHNQASSARAERVRGRQERAGLRQAGRQDRRSAEHAANVADRVKDRDQARARRQQEWEDRRAKRRERDAERKAKREAAPDRTTLGQAASEAMQRRWDKRRDDATAAEDAKDAEATEKVSLSKDKDTKDADGKGEETVKDGPDGASNATKGGKAADGPDADSKAGNGPSEKRRRFWRRRSGAGPTGWRERARRTGRARRRSRRRDSPFGAEDFTPTAEWPGRPTAPPPAGSSEDDIEDAVIIPDDPAAVTAGVKGLPPAPEPHTKRPGTSRPPTSKGSNVSSAEASRPSGQGGLAARHHTDITFDEYLMVMANIAIKAAFDQERAEALAQALGNVADALRDMAGDLVGDHNVSTAVTDLILDLADAAGRMKQQAERCAAECGLALEAAKLAASMVARVYGEDMAAKEDAGLKYTSAAAHHD